MSLNIKPVEPEVRKHNKIDHDTYKKVLHWESVYTVDRLKEIFGDKYSKWFAFDTETDGLDYNELSIVGFSFSLDGKNGYYVPLRHSNDENAEWETLDFIVDRIIKHPVVLMFNKKFDLNVLEVVEGYDLGYRWNVVDVQIAVWLRDTEMKTPSLKDSAEYFLGIKQPHFAETVGSNTFNFAKVEDIVEYAALDAIITYILFFSTMKWYKDIYNILKLDNGAAEAIRKMEHNKIPLDKEFLKNENKKVLSVIEKTRSDIIREAGYDFNPNSGRQKAEALLNAGVNLTEKTAPTKTFPNGQYKVSEEVLEKFDHPLAKALVEYASQVTYYRNYVKKLYEESYNKGFARFNYMFCQAPTGRLSCGTEKKNNYFTTLNLQSVTKSKEIEVGLVRDINSITGYSEVPYEEVMDDQGNPKFDKYSEFYITETTSSEQGIRQAFIPEEDSVYVSIDYSAQELRIAANLSGEGKMLEAFERGEDLHMKTARQIFGENADHNQRKIAKSINFLSLYGGTEYALSRRIDVDLDKAKSYLDKYNSQFNNLNKWKNYMKRIAVDQKVIYTKEGRPRRMSRFFSKDSSKMQKGFGYRTALNFPVQGTGADILKKAIYKVYKYIEKYPEIEKKFSVLSMVHDEINFSVKNYYLYDFLDTVPKRMMYKPKDWKVPIIYGLEIGSSWGRLHKYAYDKENRLLYPDPAECDYYNVENYRNYA